MFRTCFRKIVGRYLSKILSNNVFQNFLQILFFSFFKIFISFPKIYIKFCGHSFQNYFNFFVIFFLKPTRICTSLNLKFLQILRNMNPPKFKKIILKNFQTCLRIIVPKFCEMFQNLFKISFRCFSKIFLKFHKIFQNFSKIVLTVCINNGSGLKYRVIHLKCPKHQALRRVKDVFNPPTKFAM